MSYRNKISEVPIPDLMDIRKMEHQSVEIGDGGVGHGPIRRSPSFSETDEATMLGLEHSSLLGIIQSACEKFGERRAIAYRPWLEELKKPITDDNGRVKDMTYVRLGETCYLSFVDFWEKIETLGAGLASLGLTGQNCRVGIYEETRWEWIVSLYGMWTQRTVAVTVYANLGTSALQHAIQEAELSAIFVGQKNIHHLASLGDMPSLRYLIVFEAPPPGTALPPNVEVVLFADLLRKGQRTQCSHPSLSPLSHELAMIMYTSGTTGEPKGVMMTHRNLLSGVTILERRVTPMLGKQPGPEESYIAYLPLAHILELTAENVLFSRGSMVCYGHPRTLTNTYTIPHGDLEEYKPHMIVGVPRIFDTIKKAVEAKLPPKGSLRRCIYDRAYDDRREALTRGYDTPYWNTKVFQKIRSVLGGRVKMIICGGAPLSASTHEFLTVVFGVPVGQGYGLTETVAITTIQRFWDLQKENVGGLTSAIEVKLRDVDVWTSSHNPPQGEILIRGPNITLGYYKQPEMTQEVYLPNKWFATGDVGEWAEDGTLRIIGRVKALAKNSHGEYIALEALEATYAINELVIPNGICICVNEHQPHIVAVALTDESKAKAFARKHKIGGSYPDILKDSEFLRRALISLNETAKGAGKKSFELLRSVYFGGIPEEEWTPENGALTAAMKLKRREIDSRYRECIEDMYAFIAGP